ncbi:protein of unknown function [Burkholderia multivorans]
MRARKLGKLHLGQRKSVLADDGYVGEFFVQSVREFLGEQVTVQIAKRSEPHTFKVMPQRWIIERSFAWLEKDRRYGRTARACSAPACSSSILPSWPRYSEDRKRVLDACSDPMQRCVSFGGRTVSAIIAPIVIRAPLVDWL